MGTILNKLLLLCLITIISTTLKAQDTLRVDNLKALGNYVFSNINNKYPEIDYCKYKLITPVSSVFDIFQGNVNDSITNFIGYYQLLNNLDIASNVKTTHASQILNAISNQNNINKTPISITLIENYKFRDSTISNNYIDFVNNKFVDNSPYNFYPFQKDTLFSISPLNQIIEGSSVNFTYNTDVLITNIDKNKIDSIFIDYSDGLGYRVLLANETINYITGGNKIIAVKLFIQNRVFYAKSTLEIKSNITNKLATSGCANSKPVIPPDNGPVVITTTQAGNTINGKYAVWYSPCNTSQKIRKPFIVNAGYNPGNGKQLTPGLFNDLIVSVGGVNITIPKAGGFNGEWRGTFYETYNGIYSKRFSEDEFCTYGSGTGNGNELLNRMRDEGYDIIILANDDGNDLTINNAALLMALITKINTEKMANGYYFENVVSGFSAGGITARLALATMESNYKLGVGVNPHTKLFLNIEGENQGANIPLGLQYLLNFQANGFYGVHSSNPLNATADAVSRLVAQLALKSMYSDNSNELLAYNATIAGAYAHSNRSDLLNTFNTIPLNTSNGYPEYCRKISIAQGSANAVNTAHSTNEILETRLGSDASGTAVSFPSNCGGSYTWVGPKSKKTTTARWWSANNTQNIFDGEVVIDASFTFFPLTCIKIPIINSCQCMGPFTINIPIQLKSAHVAQPNYLTPNFDDAPASSLTTQLEVFGYGYKFYNGTLLGKGFANVDTKLHAFTTTSSVLDMHDPATGLPASNFTSPQSLGLLKQYIDQSGVLQEHQYSRWGYPHLSYPNNIYAATPFDGVFAIGTNNGNFANGTSKPSNQLHVEDPQAYIGDYLTRVEVAPENLFLSNRNLATSQTNYVAEFEARNKILLGKTGLLGENIYSLESNMDYLTPNGDFTVTQQSSLIVHAGTEIAFLPGFGVSQGASLSAYIQPYSCANLLYRINHGTKGNEQTIIAENLPQKGFNYEQPINKNINKVLNSFLLYPNPNSGSFTYLNVYDSPESILQITDLSGKLIHTQTIYNNQPIDLALQHLLQGVYIVKVTNATSTDSFKLILNK
ncbi:MAG: T9SS type A sorting domain-containing protein [Bacteroidia bacterium]|nr:T9SS type A sorting domain-containing protein [Bacteroidia bacterium]